MEVFVCSAEASAFPPSGPSEFWDTSTCCFREAREPPTVIRDIRQNFEYRRLKHSDFWLTVVMEVFVCRAEASAFPPSGPSEFWDTSTCVFLGAREPRESQTVGTEVSLFKQQQHKCKALTLSRLCDAPMPAAKAGTPLCHSNSEGAKAFAKS